MILLKFKTEIKGDSVIDKHEDWITIESLQFGVGRAISASGVGKDRETSNPSFSEVTLSKTMDKASVDLMMQATFGKSLGEATIDFVNTGGEDGAQIYLQIILSDPIVSAYSVSSGGDRPSESVSINFNKIKMQYNSFDKGGSLTKGDMKGWDLMTQKQWT